MFFAKPARHHFNSCMVRLKAWEITHMLQTLQFQFLYGAIKSMLRKYRLVNRTIQELKSGEMGK